MPGHDIVVIGASAGGVEALTKLLGTLPANMPASVFIVLHIPAQSPSVLPEILTRAGYLKAVHPEDGGVIEQGVVYVAPPDHHLLIEPEKVRVVRGPKENRHRPAVDPLFRSAALVYGARVIGVIMTGALDDGTSGLLAIKRRGGVAIVQDPNDALYPSMPMSALANVEVDFSVPLTGMGQLLARLVREPVGDEGGNPVSEDMKREVEYVGMEGDLGSLASNERVGTPSAFSCPDCGGVLWEIEDGELLRFRCRVGHAFSTESVLAAQSEQLEDSLWTALKTLEESASLSRRLVRQARERSQTWMARRFEEKLREAEQRAIVIRQALKKAEESSMAVTEVDQAG